MYICQEQSYIGKPHRTIEMSFTKNTQTIAAEDPLNELSTGWKIAQKTGKVYCRLDTVTDPDLGAAAEAELASPTPQPISYAGSYFAPIMRDDSALLYKFDAEDDAVNFLNYKPAAGFHPKSSSNTSYKPKQSTWNSSYKVASPPVFKGPVTAPKQTTSVTTFTDLELVSISNKDKVKENERLGLRILPASLIGTSNVINYNGDDIQVLMGKIINVQPIQQ